MNALKRLMCVLGYSMMIHYIFTAESDNEKNSKKSVKCSAYFSTNSSQWIVFFWVNFCTILCPSIFIWRDIDVIDSTTANISDISDISCYWMWMKWMKWSYIHICMEQLGRCRADRTVALILLDCGCFACVFITRSSLTYLLTYLRTMWRVFVYFLRWPLPQRKA